MKECLVGNTEINYITPSRCFKIPLSFDFCKYIYNVKFKNRNCHISTAYITVFDCVSTVDIVIHSIWCRIKLISHFYSARIVAWNTFAKNRLLIAGYVRCDIVCSIIGAIVGKKFLRRNVYVYARMILDNKVIDWGNVGKYLGNNFNI